MRRTWTIDSKFCSNVMEMPPYRGGRFGGRRDDDEIFEAVL